MAKRRVSTSYLCVVAFTKNMGFSVPKSAALQALVQLNLFKTHLLLFYRELSIQNHIFHNVLMLENFIARWEAVTGLQVRRLLCGRGRLQPWPISLENSGSRSWKVSSPSPK